MNRVISLGLALPMLLISTQALAGEPPFPAPRPEREVIIIEEDIDEDALRQQIRDELREDVRREVEAQLEAERQMDEDVVVVEEPRDVVVVDTTTPVIEERGYRHAISAGAGALGFIGDDLDFQDAVGPTWQVRYGNNLPILEDLLFENVLTWEIQYTGATDVEDGDVVMTATMFETGLKLNTIPNSVIYPIITAGIGWGAFTRDVPGGPDLEDLGTLTLPLSAGVEVALDNFLIDARATYRPVFFDEDELQFTEIGMDNWTITGTIGTRF